MNWSLAGRTPSASTHSVAWPAVARGRRRGLPQLLGAAIKGTSPVGLGKRRLPLSVSSPKPAAKLGAARSASVRVLCGLPPSNRRDSKSAELLGAGMAGDRLTVPEVAATAAGGAGAPGQGPWGGAPCERRFVAPGAGLAGDEPARGNCTAKGTCSMRASVRASASNPALAPRRRLQAQSFAISRIVPFQWRRKGDRWP